MKYIIIEKMDEDNDTFTWEYDTKEAAIENIKHMRMKEVAKYRKPSSIRLFEVTEIDISGVEGYSISDLKGIVPTE